jgi:hypothetical protein
MFNVDSDTNFSLNPSFCRMKGRQIMSLLRVYYKHYANNTQHPVVTFPAACPTGYKLLDGNGMADQVSRGR